MTEQGKFQHVGHYQGKVDGLEKVTGKGKYTHDMSLPRMAHGKILRSPHAHAVIKRIDTRRAEKHPGVFAVMVGSELPIKYGILPSSQDENVLCIDKARYVGDEIAAIAAVDEETAEEALQLIDVEYETLPPIMDIATALRTDIPKIHAHTNFANSAKRVALHFGDVEAAFKDADLVREDEFYFEQNTHAPIETHSAIGDWAPSGHVTVWSSTQTPHYLHKALARVFDMPASHIRVVKPHFGGGFGGKSEPFALEFCSAWLSKKCGRPVKITYTREEVFLAHRGRHAMKMISKIGVKKDGRITGIYFRSFLDGGAYGSYGIVTTYYSGVFLTLPYKVDAYKFEAVRLYTNKPACGPKRGHGAVQGRWVIETQMDMIAEELGLDPVDMRLKNAVEPNSLTVNALRVTSCGLKEVLTEPATRSQFKKKFRKLPYGKGIGIAAGTYISGAGKAIYWNSMPHSGAIVKVDRGGGVTVFCGSSDIGQGSNTMLALVAAEVLGVRVEDVKVCEADTDLTPVDLGSYSSRVTFMAGNACIQAANKVKEKILKAAAKELKCKVDDLVIEDREVFNKKDITKNISFVDAVQAAEAQFGTLSEVGSYTPPALGGDYKGSGAGPSPSYSFGVHIAQVDVDPETGMVKVEKMWAAHDVGRALHRTNVEGQIEGSAYMGLGEALGEEHIFTHQKLRTPAGLHKTPSFLEYKIPTVYESGDIESLIVESVDPEGPFGAKEGGEGPLLPAIPAIANAIYDAVGVRMFQVPFAPERVLEAIEREQGTPKAASTAGKKERGALDKVPFQCIDVPVPQRVRKAGKNGKNGAKRVSAKVKLKR